MWEALQKGLLWLSAWIIVLPVLVSLMFFRQFNKGLRILAIHLWIACAIELASYLLMLNKHNNLPLLHVYTLTEFSLLFMFYESYFRYTFSRRWLRGTACGFILFSLVNSLFIQNIYTFNSYARALEALLLIGLSLLCFYKMAVTVARTSRSIAWINAGILIYFSGAFTLFVLSNYILPLGYTLNVQIWAVHSFLSIFLYTFISIGLWKGRHP